MTPKASMRRFELDWLGTIGVLGLIRYHAGVVYAVGPEERNSHLPTTHAPDVGTEQHVAGGGGASLVQTH